MNKNTLEYTISDDHSQTPPFQHAKPHNDTVHECTPPPQLSTPMAATVNQHSAHLLYVCHV